jgi:hypothetical protein
MIARAFHEEFRCMPRHFAVRLAILLCTVLAAASSASSQTTPRQPGD